MMAQTLKQPKNTEQYPIDPRKFNLWLLIVASVMLFAAFTSAYIVRRGEGNWLIFDLPQIFTYNTIVIVVSSVFMQLAYFYAKKDELLYIKIFLLLTLLSGIAFGIGQWLGYYQMIDNNIYLAGNPAESFVYVISFVHLAHIVGGLIFVLIVLVKTFQFKVHKKNMLSINLCTTYWHFLGALWVYLYFFFLLNR